MLVILNVDDNLVIVYGFKTWFWSFLPVFCILVVKVIGKLQDGTLFLKKGHDDEWELFKFKTDEGKLKKCLNVSPDSH